MGRRIIKWSAILFQSVFIGSMILYIYALIRYRKNWNSLDSGLKGNINTYLYVAIGSALIFIVIKVIEYLIKKNRKEVIVEDIVPEAMTIQPEKQVQSYEVPLEYQHDEVIPNVQKPLETKEEVTIPKEKQATCPNCKGIVDKDAYICLNCGILLNDVQSGPKNEKVIYKEVVVKKEDMPAKSVFTSVVMMVLVVLIMFVAYDYTRNNGVFFTQELSQIEKKEYFYSLASEVLNDFEFGVESNRIKLDPNNTYFRLSDLNYASAEYNPSQSFIAISRERVYYIIFKGQGKYEEFSIDATPKNELSVDSVAINKAPNIPIGSNEKFSIDGQFYYKNSY